MKVEDITPGMTVWVRSGDKIVKTTACYGGGYFMRGAWTRSGYVDGRCFSEAELPAARKALAAEKERWAKLEAERLKRIEDATAVAEDLSTRGVAGPTTYGSRAEKPTVDRDGRVCCAMTIEQARALLAVLPPVKGEVTT